MVLSWNSSHARHSRHGISHGYPLTNPHRLRALHRHNTPRPHSHQKSGKQIVAMLVSLKTLQQNGRISIETFWRRYFTLRKAFYLSGDWRSLVLEGPRVCSRNPKHRGRIDRHHKRTIYDAPQLALDPTNIEYLCRRCHRKEH